MGIFNHDDGGINHGTYGDGDSSETHDVGIDTLGVHDDKGHQYCHRKGENCHQGTGEMKEEKGCDQGDNNAFLYKLFFKVVNSMGNKS